MLEKLKDLALKLQLLLNPPRLVPIKVKANKAQSVSSPR